MMSPYHKAAKYVFLLTLLTSVCACSTHGTKEQMAEDAGKIRILFDTDTNNELDDQHAMAYLLLNGEAFQVAGVTVNATRGGGAVSEHFMEAERIMWLCGVDRVIPLLSGANANFLEIKDHTSETKFDGSDAVDFIIAQANAPAPSKLVLLAVGKLTNVALALKKDPSIADKIRLVWLGSNYPEPGEYNLDNDTASVNYVMQTPVPFEMVTVRYGKPSGSGAVKATHSEINQRMPGKGPHITTPVTGRHGGSYTNFGDYSSNLFDHIVYDQDAQARSLYDMVAVAVVKNPAWGEKKKIPAPVLAGGKWIDRPENKREVIIWENFDKAAIMNDFYNSMEKYVQVR